MKTFLLLLCCLLNSKSLAKPIEMSLVFYNLQNFTDKGELFHRLPKLKNVLKSLGNYPDILGLAEVGGPKILGQILNGSPYEFAIWLSKRDRRGLNLALLVKKTSNLQSIIKREIRGPKKRRFRGILEFEFSFKSGERLFLFLNHWPSQLNSFYWRNEFAKKLQLRLKKLVDNEKIILIGDFNLLDQELGYLRSYYSAFNSFSKYELKTKRTLEKTYFYFPLKKWNGLDRIFISNLLMKSQLGVAVFPDSIRVFNDKKWCRTIILNGENECIPWKFKKQKGGQHTGYSDHFPIGLIIKKK